MFISIHMFFPLFYRGSYKITDSPEGKPGGTRDKEALSFPLGVPALSGYYESTNALAPHSEGNLRLM
jgi:hypothetical protein